jgi:hypothetical protein
LVVHEVLVVVLHTLQSAFVLQLLPPMPQSAF